MFADPLLRLLSSPDPTSGRVALSTTAADEVIERSVLLGGTTDTALQELGILDEAGALAALATAYEMPVADRAAHSVYVDVDENALLRATMPRKLADSHGCCPLRVEGRKLTVLCRASPDQQGHLAQLEELGFALSVVLTPLLTTEALLALATERIYNTPIPERLQRVLTPMSIDIDFDLESLDTIDSSGWSALSPPALPPATEARWQPTATDASGWQITGPGQIVLPPSSESTTTPKLELVVDGTVEGDLPEALRQQQLLAELDAKDSERRRRRREKVLWSIDDAISEIAMGDTRDELLEVTLRFAWRRLQTAAVFVRVGSVLTCFDVLDPWLEAHDLRAFPLSAEGDHLIARAMTLMSPVVGPVDENDPICRLLGRRPRAVVVVPILLGDRAIGAVVGDNGDKPIASVVLAELQMLVPRLGKALGNLVLRARRAATVSSTLPTFLDAPLVPPTAAAGVAADVVTAAAASVDAALEVGPALPPSPGARGKEAVLQATARAWLAHPVDVELEGLVAALQQDGDVARAAVARIVAAGMRALPAIARAFPGPAPVGEHSAADATARLLRTPLFEVIERLGADRVAPIVVFALDHKDRHVRFGAVVACRQLELPAAIPGLSRRLFDAEPRIAALATDVLAHGRDQPGYDAVLTRLRDLCRRGDDVERRLAVRALAGLRDVEAIGVLIDLLPVRPRELAEEARLALVEITRQDFGIAERRWRAWFADHGTQPRRRWLIEALAHRELPLRRAAAEDLADDSIPLYGFRADGSFSERTEALERLCQALREPMPS